MGRSHTYMASRDPSRALSSLEPLDQLLATGSGVIVGLLVRGVLGAVWNGPFAQLGTQALLGKAPEGRRQRMIDGRRLWVGINKVVVKVEIVLKDGHGEDTEEPEPQRSCGPEGMGSLWQS